jgi:hypothetical protein
MAVREAIRPQWNDAYVTHPFLTSSFAQRGEPTGVEVAVWPQGVRGAIRQRPLHRADGTGRLAMWTRSLDRQPIR